MEAFLLPLAQGSRFCLLHAPTGAAAPRAAVLYLHPFAEELNRSRRMAALASRRLAESGIAVLQMDLFGCGDSDGDFGEAKWDVWIDDANAALNWLAGRFGAPLWLWGARLGGLLALESVKRRTDVRGMLLWQPQLSGKDALRQFLRIKTAEQMLHRPDGGQRVDARAQLSGGAAVEIAGYSLSPALADGIEGAEAGALPGALRIEYIEVAASSGGLSPKAAAQIAQWKEGGHQANAVIVSGGQFWQMTEPKDVPELLRATVDAMAR